jgi:hypothetical protein
MTKKLRIPSYAPNIMKRIKFRGEGQKIRHAYGRRKVRKKNYSKEDERKYHVKDVGDDIKTCLVKYMG